MYTSETSVRVRYGETDQMGYVYYGVYAMYYEVGRVESLRQLGVTYKEIEAMGVMMPVLENKSRFLAPARYDEVLRIVTIVRDPPGVRVKFEYSIYNEEDKLIHEGETLLAFIDKISGRPRRPPEAMRQVLEPFFR
jgi:acyl-CoA thioester hydrolase